MYIHVYVHFIDKLQSPELGSSSKNLREKGDEED